MLSEIKPVILLIDDDPSVRKATSRLLRSAGYEVETFSSAEQFLTREHFSGTGCIIVDLWMPGMGGIRLQETLSKAGSPIPIIFITGHGDTQMRSEVMKRGAVAFITKPFDDQEIVKAVELALGDRGTIDPAGSAL